MTFNHFLPPKTWAFMVRIADETGLSTKEIQRVALNKIFFGMGMTCEHRRIGYAKADHKPYCKDCWTRFKQEITKEYDYNTRKWSKVEKFIPLDTFLETWKEDQMSLKDKDKYV